MTLEPGNLALIDIIRAEIKDRGPQSFAWFMEQALYHPEHGYYSSGRCAIGRHGDYFTNVSVGPLFGRLLTAQFVEIWKQLGETDNFVIVEQDFFAAFRYRIVEPFPILQDRQSQTLQSFRDKAEWRDSIEPFAGVHFSNELLDAMPVRLIGQSGEKLVDLQNDEFVLGENGVEGAQGATTSKPSRRKAAFNQAALDWIENVAANLQRGYVIAVDYGHLGDEFHGSVQVRAQHRYLDSPFEGIGHADITAHVNWTTIAECAQRNGLRIAGFTDQHHFLTGIISEWPEVLQPRLFDSTVRQLPDDRVHIADREPKMKRELQTLLHPEMLGRAFQVLSLAKDRDPGAPLAGFKFAREPCSALDL